MVNYSKYIDSAKNEWRITVKAETLDGTIEQESFQTDFDIAKANKLGVCVDLNLIERIDENAYIPLIKLYESAREQEINFRYVTKDYGFAFYFDSTTGSHISDKLVKPS